jgi:hypothetical protein
MADITWTEQALADVEAVCLYIARDAPRYGHYLPDEYSRPQTALRRSLGWGGSFPRLAVTTFARCLCRVTGSSIDCS